MDGSRRHPALGPQCPELADAPVGEAVALRDVGAEQLELRHPVPRAKAQVDATVAHEVDHRHLFGDLGRRVQRREQHCGADPHPPGPGRDRRREREWLRQVAVVEQVVLGDPDGVAAESLGLLAHLQHEAVETGRVGRPFLRVAQVEVQPHVHEIASPIRCSIMN